MKFLMKKGEHYSSNKRFKIYACTKEFNWRIKFSKECWHDEKSIKQKGINKLRGVTFGTHQEDWFGKSKLTKWLVNSALLGWMPNFNDTDKKKIRLYLYYDTNGTEYRELFSSVNIDEYFDVKFLIKKNKVEVTINGGDVYYMYPKTWLKLGYHLWPFFGGRSTAPHDMTIDIDDI